MHISHPLYLAIALFHHLPLEALTTHSHYSIIHSTLVFNHNWVYSL